jgi:hypothetical protein
LLSKVVAATDGGQLIYLSQAEGGAFVAHNPPLIEVNTGILDPNDNTKAAVRSTQAAKDYLAAQSAPATGAAEAPSMRLSPMLCCLKLVSVAMLLVLVLRPSIRLLICRSMQASSLLIVSIRMAMLLKALGSTVSSQNRKYATPDGDKTQDC